MKWIVLLCLLSTLLSCNQTGCIDGNCENGYGTFVYSNGGKSTGHWENGELNGYGVTTFGKGEFEGDIYKGYFKNGLFDGKGTYYINKFDVNFTGYHKGGVRQGKFIVRFGKKSLWKGTFIGVWINDNCKAWDEFTRVTKDGEIYTKSPKEFFDSISKYYVYDDYMRFIKPLREIYKIDVTKKRITYEQISMLFDSLQMLQKKVDYSLTKIKSFREFDKDIPLKKATYDHYYTLKCGLYNEIPNLLLLLQQEPNNIKPELINKIIQPLIDKTS